MQIRLIERSTNGKTGPMPVSSSDASTCPLTCPLRGRECYAAFGPIAWQWAKLKGDWRSFIAKVFQLPQGSLWRHNEKGDLAGAGNRIDRAKLRELVRANQGKRGFTYTHKPMLGGQAARSVVVQNRAAVKEANAGGFTINLSADNLRQADQLARLGIAPVVAIVPMDQKENCLTPEGRRVVICPHPKTGRKCMDCSLCQWSNRKVIIGLPAHGTLKRQLSKRTKHENQTI